MGSDNQKAPEDAFKEMIKSAVATANTGLQQLQTTVETWKQPVSSALHTVEETSTSAFRTAQTVYQRRHEFAPEIIGGTGVVTGGYFWLRRGRVAGVLAGAAGATAAYAVVYDELDIENIPNKIFGTKK
mmetsp:Transcript_10309/g.16485  ORF Transcript_10309/g.16485 Transcript_10309/m.16485 type:complete len:129 (+) Transcript_10309:104-490(+)